MTVAEELQNIVADLSAAIAGRKSFNRVELESLRRRLTGAAEELRNDERAGVVSRLLLEDILGSVERGVADLTGLANRTRAQLKDAA